MTMPVSFLNFSASTVVCEQPCLLNAIVLRVSTSGAGITVYEGQDATSGRKMLNMVTLNNVSYQLLFPHAPFCARGLYVEVGSNVTDVCVLFTLLPIGQLEAPAD